MHINLQFISSNRFHCPLVFSEFRCRDFFFSAEAISAADRGDQILLGLALLSKVFEMKPLAPAVLPWALARLQIRDLRWLRLACDHIQGSGCERNFMKLHKALPGANLSCKDLATVAERLLFLSFFKK